MLVNCVAYQDGRKLADIKPEEISDYLSRPDCFVWVGLKDPEPGELDAMQHEFDLPELAVADAPHGGGGACGGRGAGRTAPAGRVAAQPMGGRDQASRASR